MNGTGPILYPNVTTLPSQGVGQSGAQPGSGGLKKTDGEFDQMLRSLDRTGLDPGVDLNQVRSPLRFSAHAMQRIHDRKIALDPETMSRISQAIEQAQSKGIEDTLVLTSNAALIVNVPNRTVVTAMDRNSLIGNVFTNIDGAVIV